MNTNTPQPRLVFVDDEQPLREMVAEYIGRAGYAVRTADSGATLDRMLERETADLIVLDINMPGENGLSILQRLRKTGDTPVVMLTAASRTENKIAGIDAGADDYVTKPFDLRELKARIDAVLRRRKPRFVFEVNGSNSALARKNIRPFGKLFVDLDARCLVHADGTCEPITSMEFDLLYVFLQNPDRVLTRDRLLDLANKSDNDPFDRSIDVRITRIRKKVESEPSKPQALKTIRGAGYIYTPVRRSA